MTSWFIFSTRGSIAVLKIDLAYRTNSHANRSSTGFPEDRLGSGFTPQNRHRGCLKLYVALEMLTKQNDVK